MKIMLQCTSNTVFSDKSRIIWVQLAKIKNNEKIQASISKELRNWAALRSRT